ncbi:hypothetical protein UFOVP55_18 [uncultured Caudovirales phage]|uniref:Large polyvalent protein associated domain-containing protein n=1 Tax=uncultured Caudovirales phage TaxID=2100421 RepID=A0A6J5KU78_9CAUD|nr:hypothetical protein UFOVP55_18 [uncultured Caudovirales phage]
MTMPTYDPMGNVTGGDQEVAIPEPSNESSMGSIAGRAAALGLREAIGGQGAISKTFDVVTGNGERAVKQEENTGGEELDKLLKQKWTPSAPANWYVAQIAHGLTSSSPMLGGAAVGALMTAETGPGAIVGGAVGGAVGAALQTIGPAYVNARNEGLDHDKAVDRAMVETGFASAGAAVMGAAPAVSIFGRDAMGVMRKPISEALTQIFGIQPAIGTAQKLATNAATGKEMPDANELVGDYLVNAGSGAAMVGAHAAVASRGGVERVSERSPTAEQRQALASEDTTQPPAPAQGTETAAPAPAPNNGLAPDFVEAMRGKVRAAKQNDAPQEPIAEVAQPPVTPESNAPPTTADQARTATADLDRVAAEQQARNVPESPADEVPGAQPATKPESPDTLKVQRQALADGTSRAMLYPEGVKPPKNPPKGMKRSIPFKGVGVFDYNPEQIKHKDIASLVKADKVNEILDLGPVNKTQVAESVAKGNEPVATTERTPDGVEVKAAAGTTETAPSQMEALNATKRAPENTVQQEAPEQVLAKREEDQPAGKYKFTDVKPFLGKDENGSTNWQRLADIMTEVAGPDRGWDTLNTPQQEAVLARLKAEAPTPVPAPVAPAPVAAKPVAPKAAKAKEVSKARTTSEVQPESNTHIKFGKAQIEVQPDGIGYKGLNGQSTIFYADGKGPGTRRRGEANISKMAENGVPEPLRPIFDDYANGRIKRDEVISRLREVEKSFKEAQPEEPVAPKVEKTAPTKRGPKVKMLDEDAFPPEARTEPARREPTTVEDLKKAVDQVKSGEFHPHLRDVTVLRAWASRLTDAQYKQLSDWGLYNFPRSLADTMEPGRLLSAYEQSLEKGQPVHLPDGDYSNVLDRAQDDLLGNSKSKAETAKEVSKARSEPKLEPKEPVKAEEPVTPPSKPTTGRVLYPEGVKPGVALRDVDLEAMPRDVRERMFEQLGADDSTVSEKESKGKNWTPEQRAARAENNRKAKETTDKYQPTEAEDKFFDRTPEGMAARAAIMKRAQTMLAEASKAGVDLPERIKDVTDASMRHNSELTILSEAEFLARKPDPKKGDFVRFITREKSLRAGKVEDVLSERRVEGDERKRGQQKSVEGIAAEPTGTSGTSFEADAVTTSVSKSRSGATIDDKAEKAEIKDKNGNVMKVDRQSAATGDKLTADAKAALIAQYNASANGAEKMKPTTVSERERAMLEAHGLSAKKEILLRAGEPKGKKRIELADEDVVSRHSLRDVLNKLEDGDIEFAGPMNKGIVEGVVHRLQEAVGDTPVVVVRQEALDRLAPNERPGSVHAYYDPAKDHIVVSEHWTADGKFDKQLMAHEGVHKLLSDALDTHPELRQSMQYLADESRRILKDAGVDVDAHYGLELNKGRVNVHEFLAEALSNPDLQNQLKRVKVSDDLATMLGLDEKSSNLWGVLREFARNFLFGKASASEKRQQYTMLDAVLKVSEGLDQHADMIRQINGESGAPLGDLEFAKGRFNIEKNLTERGIDEPTAKALGKMIREELGDDYNARTARKWAHDLAEEYAKTKGPATSASNATPPKGVGPKGISILNKLKPGQGTFMERARAMLKDLGSKFSRDLNDLHSPKREIQADLESATGEALPENMRFADYAKLFSPRIAGGIAKIERTITKPRRKLLGDIGKEFPEDSPTQLNEKISDWLQAYGAEERNVAMGNTDRTSKFGSGMSAETADKILSDIAANPKHQELFDRLVKITKDYENTFLDTLVREGVMGKEQADHYRAKYKKYVAFKGFADESLAEVMDNGRIGNASMDVLSDLAGRADGRESKAANPLAEMASKARFAVASAEVNRYWQSVGRAIERAGESLGKDFKDRVYVTKSIADENVKSWSKARFDDHVIGYRENGEQRFIVVKSGDLVNELRRFDQTRSDTVIGNLMQGATKALNFQKQIWTHYSPEFVARHYLARFPIEGWLNLPSIRDQGVKLTDGAYWKGLTSYVPEMHRYLTGEAPKNKELAAIFKEMEENGGIVGGHTYSEGSDFIKQLKEAKDDPGKAKAFYDWYHTSLRAMDNAQRAVVYKAARESGKSTQEAAIMARDITLDFDAKGATTALIQQFMPFANTAGKTTAGIVNRLKTSSSYRKRIAATMMGIYGINMLNYLTAGQSEDGTPNYDKIPAYIRSNALVMVIPGMKGEGGRPYYAAIPLPYNAYWFHTIADNAATMTARYAFGSKVSNGEMATRVAHGMAESFTPVGRLAGNLGAFYVPELLKPANDIKDNRNPFGAPIHRDSEMGYDPKKSKAEQGFKNTGEGYKWVADTLEKVGVDHFPEDYRYMANYVAGSALRFVGAGERSRQDLEKGDTASAVVHAPFARVFSGVADERADEYRYRNLVKQGAVDDDTKEAIKTRALGKPLDAEDKGLIAKAERRTGFTVAQLSAINEAETDLTSKWKARGKKPLPDDVRAAHYAKWLRKFNGMDIQGGYDQH